MGKEARRRSGARGQVPETHDELIA
jgi:hypothetical protein